MFFGVLTLGLAAIGVVDSLINALPPNCRLLGHYPSLSITSEGELFGFIPHAGTYHTELNMINYDLKRQDNDLGIIGVLNEKDKIFIGPVLALDEVNKYGHAFTIYLRIDNIKKEIIYGEMDSISYKNKRDQMLWHRSMHEFIVRSGFVKEICRILSSDYQSYKMKKIKWRRRKDVGPQNRSDDGSCYIRSQFIAEVMTKVSSEPNFETREFWHKMYRALEENYKLGDTDLVANYIKGYY